MSTPIVDVTGRIARLYQDDPRAFVAQRNALARDLARAGQRDLSSRIKGLARPSTSAWLLNQLYWHDRGDYDALLAAGAAARDAQQARLSGRGGDLARALAERDAIVDRLSRRGERLAAAAGIALSTDVRSRVRTSLEAIALRAGDTALAHGQLTEDVPLPGLQALAGLVLADGAAPSPTRPARPALALVQAPAAAEPDPAAAIARELDEVREAVAAARAELDTAREHADEQAGAATTAEQQRVAAARALETAQQRLAQATSMADAASARADEAAAGVARVEAGLDDLLARERALHAQLDGSHELPPPPSGARRPARGRQAKRKR